MSDLHVVVPSRGRPDSARRLAQTFDQTCSSDTRLTLAVDIDDPDISEYQSVADESDIVDLIIVEHPATMVRALNHAVERIMSISPAPGAIGFMGDDHDPRTTGWDERYLAALRDMGSGIVWGDDLIQGDVLPTQCAMTTDIIDALGYMAPPTLRHMYVDNFWLDLGRDIGSIRYLPDVVIEHMHPIAGKSDMDPGYERVNAQSVYDDDDAAYVRYRESCYGDALSRVRDRIVKHEWRLFEVGEIPEHTTPQWYEGREHAPHLEQPVHRDRLMVTAALVRQAAADLDLDTVVDIGSGDGGLLSLLPSTVRAWGYDLMPSNVRAARGRGVDVRRADVLTDPIEWGKIAVCTEVLEHLVDPHRFVRRICENSEVLVCSSPRLERPGSAYEFHTWAWDFAGYRALVTQAGWRVIRQQWVHSFQLIMAVRQ